MGKQGEEVGSIAIELVGLVMELIFAVLEALA